MTKRNVEYEHDLKCARCGRSPLAIPQEMRNRATGSTEGLQYYLLSGIST